MALSYLEKQKATLLALNPRERLEYLMSLGNELEELEAKERTPERKVPGCVSHVYLKIEVINGLVQMQACSESLIVKGFLQVVVETFSGMTVGEVLGSEKDFAAFVQETELSSSMVATRANVYASIFSFVKKTLD